MRASNVSTGQTARGECHRCGWTMEITKVSRKQAQQLHFGRHAAQLCDECIDDLKGGDLTELNRRLAPVNRASARHSNQVA